MKKILSFVLVLMLIFSMSGTALATETEVEPATETMSPMHKPNPKPNPEPKDQSSVNLSKMFDLTNCNTTSPEETFQYQITKYEVTDSSYSSDNMPMFNPDTFYISFTQGEAVKTKSVTLNLPTYEKVGKFIYKITETPGTTAGVTYDTKDYFLMITVTNSSTGNLIRQVTKLYYNDQQNQMKKVDHFLNTFSAGKLEITKEVTGNLGQKDRYFKVTVTLTAPTNKTVKDPIAVSGGSYPKNPISIAVGVPTEFYIRHDETIKINSIPYGVIYTVVEENITSDGYETTYVYSDKGSSKMMDTPTETVKITNNKQQEVPTGINLDNLPYVILLVTALGGLVVFTIRKRISHNS